MNNFGKSGARFENTLLLRKVSAYLHVYVGFIFRTREICKAELCGML
jgi:hypothetical protein